MSSLFWALAVRDQARRLATARTIREVLTRGAGHVIRLVLALILLFPMIWLVLGSVKPLNEVFIFPPVWIPHPVRWINFVKIWSLAPFAQHFVNSFTISGLSTVGDIFSSALVGFAFARMDFPGRNVLFGLCLSTLMLPYAVTLVPQFIIFRYLHWINTFLPLIVPHWFGTPFSIFLYRQFFRTIPTDLEEVAVIDGASVWVILTRIMMPLAKPAVVTVAVFTFVGTWNDFLNPLIYLDSHRLYTVALGLSFFSGDYGTQYENLLMTGSTLAAIPIIVLFIVAQRYFVQGIVMSGIAGR